jgi:hypothetical protein
MGQKEIPAPQEPPGSYNIIKLREFAGSLNFKIP